MKDYPWTDIDLKVADMMGSYWTNFAKVANPNGPGLPSWSAYNSKDEYLMNLGDTFRMERMNSAALDLIVAAKDNFGAPR
jgi:para-nitrobenzyl esterase